MGCVKVGPRFNSRMTVREICPGGEYSGLLGSRSRKQTAGTAGLVLPIPVRYRLTNLLVNVDFPESGEPVTRVVDVSLAQSSIARNHSSGFD